MSSYVFLENRRGTKRKATSQPPQNEDLDVVHDPELASSWNETFQIASRVFV